jgi:hypothetical protein
MKEKTITNKIKKYLKEEGHYVMKIAGGRYQQPGISDLIAVSPIGRFIAIEVKAPGQEPTPLQKAFLRQIKKNNGIAIWVTSLEDVKKALTFSSFTSRQSSDFDQL